MTLFEPQAAEVYAGLLVLALHEKTWGALSAGRKDFFGLFEPLPAAAKAAAKSKA
jgi:hypothetical protein